MGIWLRNFGEIQPLVLGTLLLWAGIWKILSPGARTAARESALAILVSPRAAQMGHYLLGLVEGVAGVTLLLPPPHSIEKWGVLLLGLGFLLYLSLAIRWAPGRPCACMGSQKVPISWRSLGRASLFVAMAILSWEAERSWILTFVEHPIFIGLIVGEFLLFFWLSPDVKWDWIKAFISEDTVFTGDCATSRDSLTKSLRRLRGSRAFREFQPFLRGQYVDYWREGCWRFFCFPAEWEGQSVVAVFAVPLTRHARPVRAALVDEQNQVLKRIRD